MNRFVIISGCSGGGKSTLLTELARRGHATVAEPFMRLLQAYRAGSGDPSPWEEPLLFLRRVAQVALEDRTTAKDAPGWVFFDRGLIDAASALESLGDEDALQALARPNPYHPTVFLAPPWPQIYVMDDDRRHGLDKAVREYERLSRDYPALGYAVEHLPKFSVAERADFILARLGPASA